MAALPSGRTGRRALTASAVKLGSRESEYAKRKQMPWQKRALEHVRLIPELNYASRFYARMMMQLIIFPAFLDDQGKTTRIETGEPVDILDRIQDPGGGRSSILGTYGRLMFITGEGSLFGRDLDTDAERWSFVWNDELEIKRSANDEIDVIVHKPVAGETRGKEYTPDSAVVYRIWTPDPARSGEPESPMRAAAEIAEEVIILTKSVRATAVTRMTNGIFILPSEIAPVPAEAIGDEDPENDPFISDVAAHFEAQVEEAGSAAAAAPYLMTPAYDYADRIRHLPLHDPQNDYMEQALRKEAIERMARGFDFPPEVLLGLSDSNHWAARQILDDMWRSHGAPLAEKFCDDLAEVYLRPALQEAGFARWREVVIGYDESQVVVKPDRSEDADKAYDRGLLGDDGYFVMKNIPAEWKMTPDERVRWKEYHQKTVPGTVGGRDVTQGPPPPGPEGDSGRRTRVVASAARELGAAEMALMRCRELAGTRIRHKERTCPECLEDAREAPLSLVASAVGGEILKRLGLDPFSLVQGGADTLKTMLAEYGYSDQQANELCTLIEVYAASTLFDERTPSLPLGFMAQIEQMKEAALLGGGNGAVHHRTS